MMTYPLNNNSGASAALVVFLLTAIVFLGLIFSSLFSTSSEEYAGEVSSMRALYGAEAGIETAIGRLKKTPVAANWAWKDGYSNMMVAGTSVDVEVLHFEDRSGSFASVRCESFTSMIEAAGANPARTVYAALTWDPALNANNLDMNLYSDAACATAIASPAKTVIYNAAGTVRAAVFIRYRIPNAAPATLNYSVAILNNTVGSAYTLGISHPDNTGTFTSSSMRSVISKGTNNAANREVFSSFRRP